MGHLKVLLLGTPKSGTAIIVEDVACSEQIVSYKPFDYEPTWHDMEPWGLAGHFVPSTKKTEWQKADRDTWLTLEFKGFLREHVARTHSHYYQYEENGVLQGYSDECTPQLFLQDFLLAVHKRITTGSTGNCGCEYIFEDHMYVDSFRRYYKNIKSPSFQDASFKKAALGEVVDYAGIVLNMAKDKMISWRHKDERDCRAALRAAIALPAAPHRG